MKRSLKTKLFVLVLVLMLSSAVLSAALVSISWNWSASQAGINAFRYQMDQEDDALWTVVGVETTSYETEPVDGSVPHTLYVQQSIDRIHWSASGSIVYDPVQYGEAPAAPQKTETAAATLAPASVPEPTPVPEPKPAPAATVAEVPAVKETAPAQTPAATPAAAPATAPVESQTPAASQPTELSMAKPAFADTPEAPAEIAPPIAKTVLNAKRIGVEIGGGLGGQVDNVLEAYDIGAGFFDPTDAYYDLGTKILPIGSIDLVMDNLKAIGSKWGIGMRVGIGYQMYNPDSGMVHFGDAHLSGKLDIALSRAFSMELGLGPVAVIPYANLKNNLLGAFDFANLNLFYGVMGSLGVRYNITDSFSIGTLFDARFLFSDVFVPYELTGLGKISLGIRF
ncbi:MAG: hypothetical protein AB9828_08130 [Sphaerochaetaceae bacterium]